LLTIFQEFLLEQGASMALMSGSGSTTFALVEGRNRADQIKEKLEAKFGDTNWVGTVEVTP
jgi:4-diphosphocytidyl-2C-methyl-D-erythritol kinase